jgi:undecaprenyl-diphosphatase
MESSIILAIQRALSSDIGHAFVGFCARWVIYLYIPFALFARQYKYMRHAVYEAAWTAGVAFATSVILATLLGRVRPYLAIAGVEAIVPPNLQAGSFPSSHTAVAVGVAVAFTYANVPFGIAEIVMAALVAFGRVAAGMHFPSDVLGGALVGVLAFVIVRICHAGLAHLK